MSTQIRPLKDNEIDEVVKLFNIAFQEAYYGYPMSKEKFLQKLNNPNFYKRALILNHTDKMGGFILANTAKRESKWYRSDKGYISLVMVPPEFRRKGFGKALVEEALNFLKKEGKTEIETTFNPLTFWPGIDSNWDEALLFFKKLGFKETKMSVSMVANLEDLKAPGEILQKERKLNREKIFIRPYLKDDRETLLNFVKKNFGYEWYEEVKSKVQKVKVGFTGYGLNLNTLYDPKSVLVLLKEEKIIGFSMFSKNFEKKGLGHFGPIGIQGDFRGKGIGLVLLFETLKEMKSKGIVKADLWTDYGGYQARHYYPKAGFKIVKNWITMAKSTR